MKQTNDKFDELPLAVADGGEFCRCPEGKPPPPGRIVGGPNRCPTCKHERLPTWNL